MERLTQWFGSGVHRVAGMTPEHEEKHTTEELIGLLLDALARYEDTDLTPDQIEALQEENARLTTPDTVRINRLERIAKQADDHGGIDHLAGLPSSQDVEGFDEWSREEDAEKLHRLAIVSIGRRNGKELNSQIAQVAAVAGITMAEFDEALRRVGELINQAAAAAAEMLTAVIQTINDVYAPGLAAAWEEMQKLMEQYADVDEPEEEDRRDGAVVVLVAWLPLAPTLYELYGQGVDHGGPGPSRLTLIRVTDDGLWRAETETKQERRTR